VLSIIGGPGGSWGPEPWLPDLALAAAGARMLMPDPRGSASYGRAWLEAIRGAWGGADAEDQLACVDWAVGEGIADPARLGVTGLSYGGFMVNWLITQTDRFRAAVCANGVANQVSAVANCDEGPLWTPRLGWGYPPADHERLWQQSPLAHADAITTPLLMLQGEADMRCPPSDNEQLFVALRVLRREVEYVLYPEESHLMQAVGRPDRRIDMLERTERWFRAHGVLDAS
jgi:dipeptidyl aminopeptidase/acylaminoacyl peptidase